MIAFARVVNVNVANLDVSGLRVSFKITKTNTKEPNTCDVKIYNLDEDARSKASVREAKIEIIAGYKDSNGLMFIGDIRDVLHSLDGVDWVTTIKAGDGATAYATARLSRSYAAGVSVDAILSDLNSKLGKNVKLPSFGVSLAAGFSAYGPAIKTMDEITRRLGATWSIQNGVLKLRKEDETKAIFEFNFESILGQVDHSAPKNKGGAPGLKFKSPLRFDISPGDVARINTKGVSGDFTILKVEHRGDTHGPEWVTEIECSGVKP